MEKDLLAPWNPWWETKEVPVVLQGRARTLNKELFDSLQVKEVTILTGVRRAGKTTLMYQMIALLLKKVQPSQLFYLNLDDPLLKNESLETIYNYYRQTINPDAMAYIFLDEIQNIRGWESFIKKYYDLKEPVKFVVSGSSAALLKGEYSTLLTGRNLTFVIYPLSFKEYLTFGNINAHRRILPHKNKILHVLQEYFEFGGFPEVCLRDKEAKKILLRQYFDDIIYKDIVGRYDVNAKKVTDLAIYLLTNIANIFTIRKIRNFTGLSMDSIKDYISYLEEAYLLFTLDHFSYSLKETSQKHKKSYALDTGIRNLAGFTFSKDMGRIAENIVCTTLKRMGEDVYYWNSLKQKEVDFVIKHADFSLTAINVSYTDDVHKRELVSLQEFKKEFKKVKKLIVITRDIDKEAEGITFIPLWKWLLM